MGKKWTEIWHQHSRESKLRTYQNTDYREKVAKAKRANWQNPEFVEKTIRNRIIGYQKAQAIKRKIKFPSQKGEWTYRVHRQLFETTKTIFARNNFEVQAFQRLEDNPLVLRWIYLDTLIHFFSPKYSKLLYQCVDLTVFYKNGEKKFIMLYENGIPSTIEAFARFTALQNHCYKNNIPFEVWTKEDLT